MADQLTKKQRKAVAAAMTEMVDGGTAPTAKALTEALGFKVGEADCSDIAAKLYPPDDRNPEDQNGKPSDLANAVPLGVPDATLEACAGAARVLAGRLEGEPNGALLLRKCGKDHIAAVQKAGVDPDKVASWACAEASRRSSANEV